MRFKIVPNRLAAFAYDLTATMIAVALAFAARLGVDGLPEAGALFRMVGAFVVVAVVIYPLSRMYNASWRYTSLRELSAIIRGVTLTVLSAVLVIFMFDRALPLPRTVPVIAWFFLIVCLGAGRLALREIREFGKGETLLPRFRRAAGVQTGGRRPVLLYGFGDDAELFIRSAENKRRSSDHQPIAIVDDHPKNWGRQLRGVPVIGPLEQLPEKIGRLNPRPERLIIMNDLMVRPTFRASMQQLLTIAEKAGIEAARFTGVGDLISPVGDGAGEIRAIDTEAVLHRSSVMLDLSGIEQMIRGNTVLITGAGGSIGSEIARQIAPLRPDRIVLLENSEFALYRIDMEMRAAAGESVIEPVLCDIKEAEAIRRIFAQYRPDVVFHAAALKHVPLVEMNPLEGIRTNIFGTLNVARASVEARVQAFVQISTDKAVRPSNVMGATKRLGEMICQGLDVESAETRFIAVRFGNVLGSTGSVVPLFRRQIAQGGPVTVTSPEVTRYFMTIQEAVQLVLKASAHSISRPDMRGKIFVLDMGDPVHIIELARKMIRLEGLEPGRDVEIRFIGLRPGEKMHEELFDPVDEMAVQETDGLTVIEAAGGRFHDLERQLDLLAKAVAGRNAPLALDLLRSAIAGSSDRMSERA
ncbi:MAG: polysaccharide biosynthesis protein [Rhodobiaceae bacterium]|nr:polysaccharide biosynthesis protein [Rhodobiaceae bacterium]MCC0055194.1 polysaccharide biosynthesis protein [Rhodobiaceae bacterium]